MGWIRYHAKPNPGAVWNMFGLVVEASKVRIELRHGYRRDVRRVVGSAHGGGDFEEVTASGMQCEAGGHASVYERYHEPLSGVGVDIEQVSKLLTRVGEALVRSDVAVEHEDGPIIMDYEEIAESVDEPDCKRFGQECCPSGQ